MIGRKVSFFDNTIEGEIIDKVIVRDGGTSTSITKYVILVDDQIQLVEPRYINRVLEE